MCKGAFWKKNYVLKAFFWEIYLRIACKSVILCLLTPFIRDDSLILLLFYQQSSFPSSKSHMLTYFLPWIQKNYNSHQVYPYTSFKFLPILLSSHRWKHLLHSGWKGSSNPFSKTEIKCFLYWNWSKSSNFISEGLYLVLKCQKGSKNAEKSHIFGL